MILKRFVVIAHKYAIMNCLLIPVVVIDQLSSLKNETVSFNSSVCF